MKMLFILSVLVLLIFGCTKANEFTWAFTQNMDNSVLDNEFCREPLARTLYKKTTAGEAKREGKSHVFIFHGDGGPETYRIYGFESQSECESALTKIKIKQAL